MGDRSKRPVMAIPPVSAAAMRCGRAVGLAGAGHAGTRPLAENHGTNAPIPQWPLVPRPPNAYLCVLSSGGLKPTMMGGEAYREQHSHA